MRELLAAYPALITGPGTHGEAFSMSIFLVSVLIFLVTATPTARAVSFKGG
jgi:hypothetical protein